MKKFLTAGLLVLSVAYCAESALPPLKTLYLTGSTAFRGVEFNVLNANIVDDSASGYPVKEVIGSGSVNVFSFSGKWAGAGGPYPIKVYAAYSGSVEGQRDLLTGAANTYSKLPIADGGAGTFTHVATLTFSDSFQNTTRYGTSFGFAPLVSDTVAVQPFVFVMNKAAYDVGVRNMTDQTFRLLGSSGNRELTFFKGDGDFGTLVYFSGRNDLSGTRTVTFAETGYGVFTPAQHYGNGVITGVNPNTSRGANGLTQVALVANDGWSSGSFVRADMNNASCPVPFVGYLSAGDARTLTGVDGIAAGAAGDTGDFSSWYLTYEGIPYTSANVINGAYTYWGFEHMYRKGDNADANAFSGNFKSATNTLLLGTYLADNYPAGIPTSVMQVDRSAEATGITSGPVQ